MLEIDRERTRIIDGRAAAREVEEAVKAGVESLAEHGTPRLCVVRVGDDEASRVYVRQKEKACGRVSMETVSHALPGDVDTGDVLELIAGLNADPDITGILVQLPLPEGMDQNRVIEAVDRSKDVDGFHPYNLGRTFAGLDSIVPCTPAGVMELLHRHNVELRGRKAVVVGRSTVVGRPMAALLLREDATVEICHSRTADLALETSSADILVAAVGRPGMITADMIKPGAVVMDVGINRVDGKLVGDVDHDGAMEKASLLTPVPGGVGPMTVAMLMANTLKAFRSGRGLK